MSDYHTQAEFLITRGYITGLTIGQLAEQLEKRANKPVEPNMHTRETVWEASAQDYVKAKREAASENQKRLITPGERQSAALEQRPNVMPKVE